MAGTIADMMRDIAVQEAALKRSVRELPEAHREVLSSLVAQAYEDLVETSPVDTGAYRAEHVIEEGEGGSSGSIVYEASNRPGPDAVVQRGESQLERPDTGAAKVALSSIPLFATVAIVNRRFYAAFLEYGTAQMAPRAIYARVAAAASAAASRIDISARRLGLE